SVFRSTPRGIPNESPVVPQVREEAAPRLQSRPPPRQGLRDLQEQSALQGAPALSARVPDFGGAARCGPFAFEPCGFAGLPPPSWNGRQASATTNAILPIRTGASVMKLRFVLGSAPLLATVLMAATAVHADTFDVRSNAARSHRADVPTRGMSMTQVEK